MSGQLARRALLAGTAGVAAGAVAGKEAIAAESKAAHNELVMVPNE